MAPKKAPSMSLLFHPKKNVKQATQAPSPKPGTSQSPRKQPSPPKKDEDEEELQLPEGPYQEFRLLSSVLNGWKYDVMKFESRRPVDVFRWTQPIKLNRKDLRRDDGVANVVPEAVGPMLGPDGKPVIGADGKMVMVDAEGRPIQGSSGTTNAKQDKGKAAAKKRFQRKTRQVFFVPEEVRQMRREERYPWVMEDSSTTHNELWIGQMEDLKKSETHGFFMPAANDVFKFVPAHRWYKFQKKLKHDLPTDTANVESLYNQSQKRDPQAWLASRKGKGPSSATVAMFKAEAEGRDVPGSSSLVYSSGQSLGPGGRKLKAVDSGMDNLFDDDEDGEGGASRRRKRELGEEGDIDEQLYEDDFADDDEKMEIDDNDEEAKELEERLKKEYQSANKQREAGVDESEEEDDGQPRNKQAKAMQKLIRDREGNEVYESDEEKNPYASSEEEEVEEEPVLATASSAIQEQQQKVESRAQTPKPVAPGPRPLAIPATRSRAASPVLSPGHGGHSIVAKRATSPKIPKPKVVNVSRGNSPLGGQQSIGGSRPTSPVAVPNGTSDMKVGFKRKAEDSPTSPTSHNVNAAAVNSQNQLPKAKKRKPPPGVNPIVVTSVELESLLVDWLRKTTTATTRDCIHHFTPYLTDQDIKNEFSAMVRKHAQLKGGILVLRTRSGSTAPSPPATNGAS
ncbi:Rap30/74 interaction domain-containing protein [Pholiota conissans]|uniref:Rap30/74 interaction domain-containing protein n=1 Tax=Pholiota conissans TaxID=109636 RepID=A0A9P5ZBV0_9AGAR|nr:Rap30/74 interaction domain-containing protein [Pholiota conissans]